MRAAALLTLAAAVGCGGTAMGPTGSQAGDVDLRIVAPTTWTAAQLASVSSLSVAASGAQIALVGTSYTLGRPMQAVERIVVHLRNGSPPVTLSAVAQSGDRLLGLGTVDVTLKGATPTQATILLGDRLADGFLPGDAGSAVTVSPSSASLFVNQSVQLRALGPVTWQVQEGAAGGTIDASGKYSAPATAGSYHVVATSTLYFQQSTTVTITVAANGIAPYFGTLGGPGLRDGIGAMARLEQSNGVTSDGRYVYFTNTPHGLVRRFDPATNSVTTIAGSAVAFADQDGTGTAAVMSSPQGIVSDGKGNLFVATASRVRQIVLATGAVTTLAGSAAFGQVDGPPATAQLNGPGALVYDGSGALYVFQEIGCALRRIDLPSGNVTTVAGPAPGTSGPTCGTFTAGTGTAARLCGDARMAYLGGVVYLVELCSGTFGLHRFTVATGAVDSVASQLASNVLGLTMQGNTLWAFTGDGTLAQLNPATGALSPVVGGLMQTTFDGAFIGQTAYTFTGDVIVAVDVGAKSVQGILAGQRLGSGSAGVIPVLYGFKAMTLGPDGNLYRGFGEWNPQVPLDKIDVHNNTITPITSNIGASAGSCSTLATDGTLLYTVADNSIVTVPIAGGAFTKLVSPPAVVQPSAFALDAAGGYLYFADPPIIRRLKLSDNSLSLVAGTMGAAGGMDGTGAAAQFTSLNHMVYDGVGRLYVGDGAAIRVVTVPGGVVTTLAGNFQYTLGACTDGVGPAARFGDPRHVVLDPTKKYLYVADARCDTIRRVTIADGTVTTVAGTAGQSATVPGALPSTLSDPADLVFSPFGELLVSVPEDNSIVQIRL